MSFTDSQKKKYIKSGRGKCPLCGSPATMTGSKQRPRMTTHIMAECNNPNCACGWTEVIEAKLTDIFMTKKCESSPRPRTRQGGGK